MHHLGLTYSLRNIGVTGPRVAAPRCNFSAFSFGIQPPECRRPQHTTYTNMAGEAFPKQTPDGFGV